MEAGCNGEADLYPKVSIITAAASALISEGYHM